VKALYDLPAPAKLNTFLHITGRRADGYHLLQSAFMLIDWCDHLHLELRPDGIISREDLGDASSTPLPPEDLCVRAARALQAGLPHGHPARRLGVHIGLHKRIPAEAGMGGGSSDAATCLLGLNRLWKLHKPLPDLQRIGLSLGADVPFFLQGRNAWVEGIGEQITPIDLPEARFLVTKAPMGLPTAQIFGHPALPRGTAPAIMTGFVASQGRDSTEIYSFGCNDLQAVAGSLCPGVPQGLDWLTSQSPDLSTGSVRMTGSGSAVFGLWRGGSVCPTPPPGFVARICSNMPAHPLWGWARQG
jgi:4-diphosphocytidyl-2-C-methyl-D-erythritol kinase